MSTILYQFIKEMHWFKISRNLLHGFKLIMKTKCFRIFGKVFWSGSYGSCSKTYFFGKWILFNVFFLFNKFYSILKRFVYVPKVFKTGPDGWTVNRTYSRSVSPSRYFYRKTAQKTAKLVKNRESEVKADGLHGLKQFRRRCNFSKKNNS
jgi:hypothetical protein